MNLGDLMMLVFAGGAVTLLVFLFGFAIGRDHQKRPEL